MTAKDPKLQTDTVAAKAMESPSAGHSSVAPKPAAAAGKIPQPAAGDPGPTPGDGTTEGEKAPAADDAEGSGAGKTDTGPDSGPLAQELKQARQQAEENYDRYVRAQAEFENFRKRSQKEQAESLKYALVPLLRELIGIMDNLKRAMEHAGSNAEQEASPLLSGIEMVAKQLDETFERHGMQRIDAKGKPFDPNLHEAMSIVETDDVPENQVLDEFQPGYLLHDRVVRPAMVTVSKAKKAATGETPDKQAPETN